MCAAQLARAGRSVLVIDHARRIAEKIRISGGGRCNFTNRQVGVEHFISENPAFARSALARYTPQDFIALVERHGIAFHEKHRGQLFCDRSSQDIIDLLLAECRLGPVQIRAECAVSAIRALPVSEGGASGGYALETSQGPVRCHHLVIACGGLSIPKIGASDFGYQVARQFGHRIVTPAPALVPLTFDATQLPVLPGLSLPVRIACPSTWARRGTMQFDEDMLFTHKGLSGPAILQISSYRDPHAALSIDLAPGLDVLAHLKQSRQGNRTSLNQVLSQRLPRRLVEALVPAGEGARRLADLSDAVLRQTDVSLKGLRALPTGDEGYAKAEVTRGGVATQELNQSSMESRLQRGLFFIGEVVDVTGWLGGYNFQWAWSSAVACARAIAAAPA